MELTADFWNERYLNRQTGWDIGYTSTPLKTYFDQLTDKTLRILLPGAGNAYEAIYLADKGFTNVTVIDIARAATQSLSEKLSPAQKKSIHIIHGDFFSLEGEFDLIIEQTFFCAINPSLRVQYVEKTANLLTGNGKLAGLLFNREFDTNPPFGGTEEMYRQLFLNRFRIKYLEACDNSIPARQGTELFMLMQKNKA
ncbi:MAG: hypothetical protein RLZZ28_1897 [Bacteroidota bacterium]